VRIGIEIENEMEVKCTHIRTYRNINIHTLTISYTPTHTQQRVSDVPVGFTDDVVCGGTSKLGCICIASYRVK
jgi:hypothetical protein